MFNQVQEMCKWFLAGNQLDGVYVGKKDPTVSVQYDGFKSLVINTTEIEVDCCFDAACIILGMLDNTEVEKFKVPANQNQYLYDNLFG